MPTTVTTLTALLDDLRAGASQEEWAAQLGVTQQAVSAWYQRGRIGAKGLTRLWRRYPHHINALMRFLDTTDDTEVQP